MLTVLRIENIALIDALEVEFSKGLNILTGETGAGKSVIIGSIGIALGGKFDRALLRNEEKDGLVEVSFTLTDGDLERIKEQGCLPEDILDHELVITRKILKNRVVNRINGETVPIGILKDTAELLINLHAAMWPMLLVFMLPYILDSIPLKIEKFKKEPNGNCLFLLGSFAVSIVMGLINPYGVENMLYLTKSYGHSSFNLILEMKPTSLTATEGIMFFIAIALTGIVALFIKKRALTVRFFLLYAGTLALGLMQIKGIPYFFMFGLPAFAYIIKDF